MASKRKVSDNIQKLRASERAAAKREARRIEDNNRAQIINMLQQRQYYGRYDKPLAVSDSNLDHSAVRRAMSYVLSQRAQKVITSFGISPAVSVDVIDSYYDDSKPKIEACTDFKDISVRIASEDLSVSDMDKLSNMLMSLKGAIYHEAGHILCTMPLNALFNCMLIERGWYPLDTYHRYYTGEEQYIDALVELFPAYEEEIRRGLSYSVSISIDDLDYHEKESVRKARDPKNLLRAINEREHYSTLSKIRGDLKKAWGILEDGRMEDQMSRKNPVMQDYFKTLTLNYIVSAEMPGYSWPGIVTRRHLGEEIIDNLREFAFQYVDQMGKRRSLVEDIEKQVSIYRQSTTVHEVISAISGMAVLLEEWRPDEDDKNPNPDIDNPLMNHSEGIPGTRFGTNQTTIVNEKPDIGNESKGWDTKSDNDSEKDTDESDGSQPTNPNPTSTTPIQGNGEGEGSSDNKNQNKTQQSPGGSDGTGGVIKHDVDYDALRQNLKEKAEQLSQDLTSINDATELISEVNSELKEEIPHNSATTTMPPKILDRAKEVENGMLSALEPLAVTPDPSWRFRQEDGILDPTSYKLKEPGDTDFWINYEGEGAHGHNLAVSVLLDTSSSMEEWMDELSAGAYGIRKACEALDIPCTVSTFDTQGYMLWRADEEANPVLIHDGGGTNPLESLQNIRFQGAGKQKHLVVVLTDGQWSGGVNSVIPFIEPHQHWVLIGLSYSPEHAVYLVDRKGANSAIGITNVSELPKQIELALMKFLA